MIDREDVQTEQSKDEEQYEEYLLLIRELKRRGVDFPPFDVYGMVSYNPLIYGEFPEQGPHVGEFAIFLNKTCVDVMGTSHICKNFAGVIVSDQYGRVVLYNKDAKMYLGWLNYTDIEITRLFDQNTDKWLN